MNPPFQPFERLRAHAIAALLPFFMDGPSSDPAIARSKIERLLNCYKAATPKELQLVAEILANEGAALGCMSAAAAAKNLSINETVKLYVTALELNRSWLHNTNKFEARRRARARNRGTMSPQNTDWNEDEFQIAINPALEKLNDARAKVAAYKATQAPAKQKTKLNYYLAEQMTPSVLAHRHAAQAGGWSQTLS